MKIKDIIRVADFFEMKFFRANIDFDAYNALILHSNHIEDVAGH